MLTRCARPTIGPRKWSTYTVLGFIGYGVASVFAAVLAVHWQLSLGARAIGMIAPPLAFIVTVTIATAVKGREWIVFYQAAIAAVASVVGVAAIAGVSLGRTLDLAVLGIGVFLVFGRLGCFHVACCHGRPAARGVRYGDAHVAAGFWPRWRGRTLVPVQLVEAAASAGLVGIALALASVPGRAAIVYASGYAAFRFAIEHWRGDPVRPFLAGLSEAQWSSLGVAGACAAVWPAIGTAAVAGALAIAATALVATRRRRELVQSPHLRELARACDELAADPARGKRETRLGVAVSMHAMPDGRTDWVMSSAHAAWGVETARRIARDLFDEPELVEGRTAGVVHVLVG